MTTADALALELGDCRPRVLQAPRHQLDGARDDPLSLVDLTISELNRQMIAPESAKKHTPLPISIPSAPVTVDSHLSTSSDPPLSYTAYPEEDRVVSPYSDSSPNSSCESSPPSPAPKTPPDEESRTLSTLGGKPVHIDFINPPSDIKMKHDKIRIHDARECTWRFGLWC